MALIEKTCGDMMAASSGRGGRGGRGGHGRGGYRRY